MTATTMRRLRHIHIDAPDGLAALDLERRLSYMNATAVCVRGRWSVDVFDDADRDEEIDATIHHWLRDLGRIRTFVRIDGMAHEVVDGSRFTVDYEQRVLEHEP
jgi:hypothetical protein